MNTPRSLLACLGLGLLAPAIHAAITPDPDNGGLLLPPGFRAVVAADGLMNGRSGDALRFLAVAPNGDVYAKTSAGGIFALRDNNGDGRFEERQEFGTGGGTGIAVRDGWIYSSTTRAVERYRRDGDELVPAGAPEVVVSGLPDEGQHNSKAFAFDDEGRLLVEIGSPANAYSEGDRERGAKGKDATEFLRTHGGFWRFDPNRLNQRLADGFHFSTGHRHSLAIAWQPAARAFYMVMMGRDNLDTVDPDDYDALDNAERVAEEMHRLREGVNLGWPYTYWDPIKNARMVAPEFGGDNRKRAPADRYDAPGLAFPAHWAPLQMTFYTGGLFPARYRGGAFIAFHGSWNRAPLPQAGFNVSFVPFDAKGAPLGTFEVFAQGAAGHRFRMGGVAVAPDGSLYISDTDQGRIWRIFYTGEPTGSAANATAPAAAEPARTAPKVGSARGRSLYVQNCAVCHMADGTGAGQMQPALAGSKVVAGDPAQLVQVLLRGPANVLPADRTKYLNVMPAFASLSDRDVAEVLSYVRAAFGGDASAITPQQVASTRASTAPSPSP
jgi:glucose/arabinose dehydrogenase/cytochrome c5